MLRKTNQNQKPEIKQNFFASFLTPQNFTSDTNITSSLSSTSPVLQQLQIDPTRCSAQTLQELNYLIHEVLKYPQAAQSEIHSKANRLGLADIVEQDSSDCGLIVQKQAIPFCTSFKQFPNTGIGIYLLFQCFKNIGILILILGIIFSGYSLYINISEPTESLTLDNLPTKLSYGSVVIYFVQNTDIEFSVLVEAWLVAGVVVVWVIVLSYMNVQDIKIEQMIDLKTITASDFTVMIENIPYSMSQQQLQAQFDRYYQKLVSEKHINSENSEQKTDLKQFKIKKICKGIPFYLVQNEKQLERIDEMDEQLTQYKQKFANWVEEVQVHHKFESTNKQQRDTEYEKYLQLKREKDQIQGSKYTRFQNRSDSLAIKQTVFFVTFAKSQSANIICDFNPQAISQKLRDFIGCCSTVVYFKLQSHKQNQNVTVCRAPEPQDIIWQNIGMQFNSIVRRKCLTFFVTLLLLGVSFGSVYGLTLLELEQDSSVLLYGTSVIITVINEIIGTAIYNLTIYEKNLTKTSRQISLAIKTVLAQIINSILIPVIVDVYYLKNIYFANGLVQDVYYMAITNAILPPVLTLINSTYLISRIKAWYKKRPYPRLALQQQSLNEYCQLPEYQLGYAYIYYIDCFFFTCFYVTMQPFIVIFSLAGVILMYWIQKHRLLQRSSRPIPSTSLLADAMWQLIFFGPFILSIGHIVWFNLVTDNGFEISKFIYIPQVVSMTISVVFFCLPVDSILHANFASRDEEILDYDECVSKLKSDYDRLNPATKEEGLSIFMKFIEKAFGKMDSIQDKGKGFFTQKQNESKISLRNQNLTEEELFPNNDKTLSFVENKQAINNNIFMQLEEDEEGQGNLPINIFASMFESKPKRKLKNSKHGQVKPDFSNNIGPTLQSNNSPKQAANSNKKNKFSKSPYNANMR